MTDGMLHMMTLSGAAGLGWAGLGLGCAGLGQVLGVLGMTDDMLDIPKDFPDQPLFVLQNVRPNEPAHFGNSAWARRWPPRTFLPPL